MFTDSMSTRARQVPRHYGAYQNDGEGRHHIRKIAEQAAAKLGGKRASERAEP